MDSTRKAVSTSNDLTAFLDHYGYRLPATVKLVEGFRGTSEADTLNFGQIFVLHKVERQKTIMALDELGQEMCLQQNSNTKVHLIPLESREYCTVKELVAAKVSYVLVLEDITSSLQITSGSKLILPNISRSKENFLRCELLDRDNSKEILLPLGLKGRFLPLVDVTDYNLHDVLHRSQLPIKVRFVSSSTRANDPFNAHSLTKLGNIQLTEKSEVDMVFAASMEKELLVYLFPKTLNVRVSCGFKVSAEMSKKIKTCREALRKNDRNLKILDNLIKSSFYFKARPVRSFNLRAMKTEPVPHPRSLVTKPGKPLDDPSSKRKVLIRHELVAASTSNSSCSVFPIQKLVPERDVISEFFPRGASPSLAPSKLMDVFIRQDSSAVMEVPPLLPKLGTLSRIQEKNEDFQSHRSKPPSHTPRKTVGEKVTCGGKTTEECTSLSQSERLFDYSDKSESYTVEPATSIDNHVPESFPELPPSLKTAHIENKTDANRGHADRKPPPLPPKQKSAEERNLDLPYLVVDVTDWRKIEAVFRGYAVVTDDSCIFEEDDPGDSYVDVIFEPDETSHYEDANGQKPDEIGEIDDPRDIYETPCDDIDRLQGKGNPRDEQHGSHGNHKSYNETVVGFHVSTRQRNSRSGNVEEQQKPEATKLSNTDSLNKCTKSESCAGGRQESQKRSRLREKKIAQQADQQVEEENTDDDQSYEEVENPREILQRPRLRKSKIAQEADQQIEEQSTDDDQAYEEVENPLEILQRPQLLESRIAQQVCQHVEEESTDDDQAYEELENPREILQRPRLLESRIAQQVYQHVEEESIDDDQAYEEVENPREILQRPRLLESRIAQQVRQHVEEKSTDDDQAYEEMENPREILQRPRLLESRIAQQVYQHVEEESTDDDQAYEEVESPREMLQSSKCLMGEEPEQQKTLGLKSAGISQSDSTNSSSSSGSSRTECSRQTRRETSRPASPPSNTANIWLSPRREDDCVDIKNIEQFFKLKKQLDAACAQVEDLKRQVTVKEQDSVETTRTLLKGDDSSRYQAKQFNMKTSNSKHGNNSTLDSTMASSKQPKKKSNNRIGHKGGFGQKAPSSPSLAEEGQTNTPTVRTATLSSDNDDDNYVNCCERKYVNQEVLVRSESAYFVNTSKGVPSNDDASRDGMEAIYCNTVRTEASSYSQLAYQSDEEEIAYVNVNTKDRNVEVVKTKLPDILEDETSVAGSPANLGECSC